MRGFALTGQVERVGNVDVVLGLATRTVAGVLAVRDELGVGVEDRVGPEAGGQDVRLRLRNLDRLGPKVQVLVHQPIDRLIEGQAVGRAWVFLGGRKRQEAGGGNRCRRLVGDRRDTRLVRRPQGPALPIRVGDRRGDPFGSGRSRSTSEDRVIWATRWIRSARAGSSPESG